VTTSRTRPAPAVAPTSRLGPLLRAVGALLVLVAIVIGVPLLMAQLNMAPRSLPSLHQIGTGLQQRDNGRLAALVLAVGVWICWALFVVSLLPELAAVARGNPARSLPGLGAFQLPASALVAAIVVGFTVAPMIGGLASAAHATTAPPPLPTTSTSSSPAALPSSAAAAHPRPPATVTPSASATGERPSTADARPGTASAASAYRVQRRDTLWGIAERYLHDPLRYTEIVRLNPTVIGPDNEIPVGAMLILPADATGSGLTHTDATAARREVTVMVEPGDNLYDIEQRVTGDGNNWVAGFAANHGRAEPAGEHYADPDLIKPGWTLAIPLPAPPAPPTTRPSAPGVPPAADAMTPPAPSAHRPQTETGPGAGLTPARPTQPVPTRLPATPAGPPAAVSRSASAQPAEPAATPNSSRSSDDPMLAFAGGGLLLAGVSVLALTGYRRRQAQRRHPGRLIGASPPGLIATERAVLAAGAVGAVNVTWLDEALRSLVASTADLPGGRLPDVIAVRMTDTELTLLLTGDAPCAPPPWRGSDDGTRWTIGRDDPLPYQASRRDAYFAPYPTLTSVGYTESGEHWMLDLERAATVSLSGDAEGCVNLARFLAAELAHNTWSELLSVTLVGFGRELVAANPDRLTYTDDLPAAAAHLTRRLESVDAATRAVATDVLDGRLHDVAGDQWAPDVLLVAPHAAADTDALDELLAAISRHPGRVPVAVVLAGGCDRADAAAWQLRVDRDGALSVPALGLDLIAEQIPAAEAGPLAQMLAWAASCPDEPIPPAHGDQPYDTYADACGGLIVDADQMPGAQNTADADSTAAEVVEVPVLLVAESSPWQTNSILPLPPQSYLDRAATTSEDLQALAPVVDEHTRDQVRQSVGDLDADLDAWHDQAGARPKLTLLGPVQVRAQGSLPALSPQLAFHTEIVAYLATRPNGALSTEYAEAMWPTDPDIIGKPKVRQSISTVRRWLGADPTSGEEYLPAGPYETKIARYQIRSLLCDAELFRRLRLRGQSRGPDGLGDLWAALNLVVGRPFADIPIRRESANGPGGWGWLTDANQRLDLEYQAMIVDTAHTLADRHLGAAEPKLAAEAAQVALRAGTYDDIPLLDLIAACLAQDQDAEAEGYVRQLLSNSGVEREEDLQPRTAQVLFRLRRRWRDRAS